MGSESSEMLEELALGLLEPKSVTRNKILYHVRRAKRLRIYWIVLDPLERALLEAAIRARVDEYRGRVIRSILARLIAKIELHTLKGRIILLGLRRALSRLPGLVLRGFAWLLKWARRKLDYIRYLGRSMLVVELYFSPYLELM